VLGEGFAMPTNRCEDDHQQRQPGVKEVREFPLEVIRSHDGRNATVFKLFDKQIEQLLTLETRKVTTMMQVIRQFVKEEEGLAAAEYAMLLTLIAVALIGAIGLFRAAIQTAFTTATTALS